jgi:integrase
MAWECGMNGLRDAAREYLSIRRAVGFKLEHVERLLFSYVDFAESQGATCITSELALRWATLPAEATVQWWRGRLCVVRCFARHMSALDPSHEVPPIDLLPRVCGENSRTTPYLYSGEQIIALMAAARSIRGLPAATCETLIGLLAVTGMRVGEVLRLNRDDIDWERGLLCVRHSKFDRSREIPLHHTTLDALRAYAHIRDERCPQLRSSGFFVTRSGRRPSYVTINWHFERLVSRAGLRPHSPRCRPRLHDYADLFVMPISARNPCRPR